MAYEPVSFVAGLNTGTRVASCVARLAACELMREASWWNRWRRGLMATALMAHADELEKDADAEPGDSESAPPTARATSTAPDFAKRRRDTQDGVLAPRATTS